MEESERTERIDESYNYMNFEEPVGMEDSGGMERNDESYNYGPRASLRVCVRQALYSMKKRFAMCLSFHSCCLYRSAVRRQDFFFSPVCCSCCGICVNTL